MTSDSLAGPRWCEVLDLQLNFNNIEQILLSFQHDFSKQMEWQIHHLGIVCTTTNTSLYMEDKLSLDGTVKVNL